MTTYTRVRAGLRIPANLNQKLIDIAKNKGISKNALILEILWKAVTINPEEVQANEV